MKNLIWLDDSRNPFGYIDNDPEKGSWLVFSPIKNPFNIIWVKSYKEFCAAIKNLKFPDAICFDHDLGLINHIERVNNGMSKRKSRLLKPLEKTGYDCAKFLVDYCMDNNLKLPLYNIQSSNPAGKQNIDSLLKNFIKYQDENSSENIS